MKNSFLAAVLLVSFYSVGSLALLEKDTFAIPENNKPDLLKETSTLRLDTEASIQTPTVRSDVFFNLLAGTTRPTSLSLNNSGRVVNYKFADFNAINLISTQFSYYPWAGKLGKLGVAGSAGYSFSEYRQSTQDTALHIIPLEVDLTYRGDFKSTQVVVPYVMVGPQGWLVYQRGTADQYNNSQLYKSLAATGGLAFNLNRMGLYKSRTEAEIVFQYKRSFAESSAGSDFNSNTYQLGGALSL